MSAVDPRPRDLENPRVKWLSGAPGRAGQLNRGVRASTGDWLWLLHADSRPNDENIAAAIRFATDGHRAIGWFDLAFDRDGPAAVRLNALGANLRSRWFGLPFGDQGWLMPRAVYEQLGGFDPAFGRGEDLDFIVRAHRRGIALERLRPALISSARRYRRHGWLSTTCAHLWLTLRLWQRARKRMGKDSE